jgi:hypothetical protein
LKITCLSNWIVYISVCLICFTLRLLDDYYSTDFIHDKAEIFHERLCLFQLVWINKSNYIWWAGSNNNSSFIYTIYIYIYISYEPYRLSSQIELESCVLSRVRALIFCLTWDNFSQPSRSQESHFDPGQLRSLSIRTTDLCQVDPIEMGRSWPGSKWDSWLLVGCDSS